MMKSISFYGLSGRRYVYFYHWPLEYRGGER
jgi:hypothetical protein